MNKIPELKLEPDLSDAEYKLKEIFNYLQPKIKARSSVTVGCDAQLYWEYFMAKNIISIIGVNDE